MKPPSLKSHGIVSLATLDLRVSAAHASELGSQLLMGEVVELLGRDRSKAWIKVRNDADGYTGWVRAWGLVQSNARQASAWRAEARGRVIRSHTEVRESPRGETLVSPLTWNARVIVRRRRGAYCQVELPGGRCGWVLSSALTVEEGKRPSLWSRAQTLLGVPYLWGGRSAVAFDCSGLTQQLLAEQGVKVPRDALQQYRQTRPLGPAEPVQPGDLVFFGDRRGRPAHVGLMLRDGLYVQARGCVRLSSLHPDNPLYDSELDGTFLAVRRP